ncbi:vesicular-fusion protein Sec18 [Rhodotorula toruloides]|uniref:Vesicular-fusion protein SEC18 n=1 Tax=Rhodotorula toruloides TaxID=5286 RepID=A0A511KGG5_RHOTO|nr:vesicular-fusion protein Sec18 [Rhodotorula toruloides]
MSWFSRTGDQQPPQQPQRGYSPLPPAQQPVRHHLPTSYQHTPPPPPQRDPYASSQREKPSSVSRPQPPSYSGGGGAARGGRFAVVEAPSPSHALANRVVLNEQDWGNTSYVVIKGQFVYATMFDTSIPRGAIGAARLVRQFAGLSQSGDVVDVEPFEPGQLGSDVYLAALDLEVGYWFEKNAQPTAYSADELQDVFRRAYDGLIVTVGQPLVFDFHGQNLRATVKGVQCLSLEGKGGGHGHGRTGILTSQTEVNFVKDPASAIKIKSSAKKAPPNAILAPNFKFEDMGIGGLDTEFSAIFRRAFASRIFPPGLVEKLGIQHVKGILLYGPPGTGKTLMARQIGKMLNAREPKVVNGPEILNKFVGQSEENVRKLFADAEKEYKEKGDESGLHIIIFDELDAICKQRGSTNNGTGVGDSVVNQLLSKMDGVDQLNNILLIGMTNRMDMIDEALLRPGRLEVHIEISLPDEQGRVQILTIHTAKMRQNGVMGRDVDLFELASLTKNFSGAEIGGLVKSATSFAFNRHVKVGTLAALSDDIDQMQVVREDFMNALDEVQPAFGVNEEELQAVVQNGIIHFDEHVHSILRDGKLFVDQVRTSQRTPLVSVLLHGPPGSGKTALAATIALASDFPFIKLISAENMVGFTESQKVAHLYKVFSDSYKSPLSVIVVDGLERILDWVPIGPRFSNSVLQALLVLLSKRPPKDRRLLILSTTSNRSMLAEMDAMDAFATTLRVPAVTTLSQLVRVLEDVGLFGDSNKAEQQRAINLLRQAGFGDGEEAPGQGRSFSIGVKKLLSLVEMCRQEDRGSAVDKLVAELMQLQM